MSFHFFAKSELRLFFAVAVCTPIMLLYGAALASCASAPSADAALDESSPLAFSRSIAPALEKASRGERPALAERIYRTAAAKNWIPLISDTSVVFLYRAASASVRSVEVRGDLNGWGVQSGSFPVRLDRVAGTGLFMSAPVTLDCAARLDYKIVLDGSVWIDDPGNSRKVWGGFGPNSQLAMPDYRGSPWVDSPDGGPSYWTDDRGYPPLRPSQAAEAPHGRIVADCRISSAALGYDVSYAVYLPAGFDRGRRYPLLVATDGQEYSDPKLGALPLAADRLIAARAIEPVIIVFVDPRDPANLSVNRRQDQYACNPKFASFLADELYRKIAADYPLVGRPEATAILGTSFGGLNSAYVGLTKSSVFGLVAIQSPAIKYLSFDHAELLGLYRDSPCAKLSKIWIDAGTEFDTADSAREFRDLLVSKGYSGVSYREFPEGHSWGSWRVRIPDILMYFFGTK